MQRFILGATAILGLTVFSNGAAVAETKVKLTDMHICCKGCTNGILKAVDGLKGVTVDVDQDAEEATITAADAVGAQAAIDAIAAAGYHATVQGDGVSMKAGTAPDGKVKRLTVSNAHNCCGACTRAIQAAMKTVDGVQADTCKPKQAEFVVEGNFNAQALVAALEKVGFHVTVH
jgi:copper chaperone CopZ